MPRNLGLVCLYYIQERTIQCCKELSRIVERYQYESDIVENHHETIGRSI